jgi:hypothetical protein
VTAEPRHTLPLTRHGGGAAAPLLSIRTCIACHAMELPRPCTGACDDRRLELADREGHDEAVAALELTRRRVAALAGLAERIAATPAAPADAEEAHRAAQQAARRILHELAETRSEPEPEPARRVTAWWCAGCGRIEAPQPCLGVCVRRPVDYVAAAEHDRVLAERADAQHAEEALAAAARQAAWITPRPGHAAEAWAALHWRAEHALAASGRPGADRA